jgi:hypothetical protein
VSLRDTLLQLGYVLIAGGAVFATWALLTGPLGRLTRLEPDDDTSEATHGTGDDPRSGSSRAHP